MADEMWRACTAFLIWQVTTAFLIWQVTTGIILIRWWRFTHNSVAETAKAFHLDENDAVILVW